MGTMMRRALTLALACGALAAAPAGAQSPADAGLPSSAAGLRKSPAGPVDKAAETAPQRYWYDGTRRRPLRLDPAWIADFGAAARSAPEAPRSPLRRSIGGEKALESLPADASPVFRDEAGTPRALAGGVIVRLREADVPRARERLAEAGLVPVRPIDPEGRSWLVASPPGLPSLELANQLHEGGVFESAAPNWWQPRTLK